MPDYVLYTHFIDVNNGETSKQFTGTFADNAAAQAAVSSMLTALQNLSSAYLDYYTLAEKTEVAGAPAGSSNVFERVSATVRLDTGNKRANLQVPSPVAGVFTTGTNTLDPLAAQWVAFTDELAAGQWEISDGEHVDDTVNGKRIFVNSGSTNLPS